jgi:hypothetical protein
MNQLIQVNWIKRLILGLRIISIEDQLFYPVILGPIYLLIGPWALGFFMEDSLGDSLGKSLGVLFYWGLFIEQTLVPSTIASIYALFYIVPYIYMFVIYLAAVLGHLRGRKNDVYCDRTLFVVISNIVFCIFMMFQMYHTIDVYYSYGLLESLGVCGLLRLFYFGFIGKQVFSISMSE